MIRELFCEDLAEMIVEKLLDHAGFQNFYYDLEEDAQEEIMIELREVVAEWMDNEEGEAME